MSKDYDTIKISTCCEADVCEDYDEDKDRDFFRCDKCKRECDVTEVCEFCRGTGEVDRMEQVYPNEPHYAPTGTEKCICTFHEGDYEPDDQ